MRIGPDARGWAKAVAASTKTFGGEVTLHLGLGARDSDLPTATGGGSVSIEAGAAVLRAARGDRAYLGVPLPSPAPEGQQLIAGAIRVVACPDELFQIRLSHEVGFEEEVIRFSDAEVAVLRRRRLTRGSQNHCSFAILIDPGRAAVWIDGDLVYVGRRSRSGFPRNLVLDLLPQPDRGEVRLESLVIGTRQGPLRLWTDDDFRLGEAAKAAVSGGEHLSRFVDLLVAIDDFPALLDEDLQRALGRCLLDQRPRVDEATWSRFAALCTQDVADRLDMARRNLNAPLIMAEGVTVRFSRDPSRTYSVRGLFQRPKNDLFDALQQVGFTLSTGEILGVIGRNGSGKSTLLKSITGQYPLTEGQIWTRGHPILLRPGAGMREDLSGRDNIVTAALFMGLSVRQAKDIVDDVVDFAELDDHIDRPYRYYSDGMRARLIFSTATAVTSDILLLDELLSAGDIAFQAKARARLDDFIQRARAVVVVEHGLAFVSQSATKILLLHAGAPIYYGAPNGGIDRYILDLMSEVDHARGLPLHVGRK